jgi:DNA polymerase-1
MGGRVKRGIDIETTSLDPDDGKIRLVQVFDPEKNETEAVDIFRSTVLPLTPERKLVFNGTGGRRYVEKPIEGISHNAPFEARWLREKFGLQTNLDDTMVMSQVLYGGTDAARSPRFSHSLAAVAERELGVGLSKDGQEADWSGQLTLEMVRYAALDAIVLPRIAEKLMVRIDEAGLREVYELERRVSHAVAAMERNGFAIREDRLKNFIAGKGQDAAQLRADLEEAWGINPGSSKQLREYFELEDPDDWPTTKAGAPKTDQDAMRALADEEPLIEKWMHWKRVEKLRSTYGVSLLKRIRDGRIHARFKPFGTATGRFSSSEPNLQNIPRDWAIRGLFWSGADPRAHHGGLQRHRALTCSRALARAPHDAASRRGREPTRGDRRGDLWAAAGEGQKGHS